MLSTLVALPTAEAELIFAEPLTNTKSEVSMPLDFLRDPFSLGSLHAPSTNQIEVVPVIEFDDADGIAAYEFNELLYDIADVITHKERMLEHDLFDLKCVFEFLLNPMVQWLCTVPPTISLALTARHGLEAEGHECVCDIVLVSVFIFSVMRWSTLAIWATWRCLSYVVWRYAAGSTARRFFAPWCSGTGLSV